MPARATTVRARQHSVGLLKGLSGRPHDQRDFLECHTTDHLTKDRSMHLEGKTNGDARGREIATCAAVGAEIRTCIRRLVRAWPLEPTSGRGAVSPRSPGSHLGSQWAIPKMRVYWNQAKKCKGQIPRCHCGGGARYVSDHAPARLPVGGSHFTISLFQTPEDSLTKWNG